MSPDKALPVSVDCERFVLGSILLDESLYVQAAGALETEDFSLETNKRIFKRMGDLSARNEKIDRITIANELKKFGELESCGGLTYLVSLDEGIPVSANIDSYIRIVKDKSVLRRIIFSAQQTMNRALSGEESPQEILEGAEQSLIKLTGSQIKSGEGFQSPKEILLNVPGGISGFLDPSRRAGGIGTGFYKLDEYTGGLHAGDLFVLAGRPSSGKTAMALNIAQHVALKLKLGVAIFSLEMSKESLLARMVCSAARIDSQKFRSGFLGKEDRQKLNLALDELLDSPLRIDDTPDTSPTAMRAKLKKLKSDRAPSLVVVDYLQLMSSRGRHENRQQEVSALSRSMKGVARDAGVPVILLSQLSRAVESRQGDHRPQLSDLRDSGSIEADADTVAFVFREEMYNKKREDLRGIAELIIAKQRNGPVGTINMVFLQSLTKFENRAVDHQSELGGE